MTVVYVCTEGRKAVHHGSMAEVNGMVHKWCGQHPESIETLAEMLPSERIEWVASRVLQEYCR